jgi:hypothetical protein
MVPASSLAGAPPNNSDDPRPASHLPASPEHHLVSNSTPEGYALQADGASPPVRKDTNSSISTAATIVTSATHDTDERSGTPYSSVASSPTTFASQAVFSARDGSNVTPQRRASRRRTGPLTAVQRERAHLIRKMGACPDCRRRRVAVSSQFSGRWGANCRLTDHLVPPQPP